MKEHIEVLQGILGVATSSELQRLAGTPEMAAIAVAIELMRAAKPLDEAAEREHCTAVLFAILDAEGGFGSNAFEDLLMRERAQARAEAALPLMQRLTAECLRNAELTAQLSAAQAEIERLADTHERLHNRACTAETALVFAQAEIVRMGHAMHDSASFIHDFRTKLSNLRLAAERYLRAYHEDEYPEDLAQLSTDDAVDALIDQLSEAAEASR